MIETIARVSKFTVTGHVSADRHSITQKVTEGAGEVDKAYALG